MRTLKCTSKILIALSLLSLIVQLVFSIVTLVIYGDAKTPHWQEVWLGCSLLNAIFGFLLGSISNYKLIKEILKDAFGCK